MNCDTAFDLLTDANGSRSSALTQHFETCPRCRQMQETLSPALEFLTHNEPSQEYAAGSRGGATSQAGSRQPFVTVDSLRMAQQAAGRLAAQTDFPRANRQRLAGQLTRYAAVFAAGLLLALVLVPDRESPMTPAGCTRQAAAGKNPGRTADKIQTLAQSCAVCHTVAQAPSNDKTTSLFRTELRSERANSWDWLAAFLRDENVLVDDSRCVAGSKRSVGLNAICLRVQQSFAAKEMTA